MSDFDVERWIEENSRAQIARTKAFLLEAGRPDLVAELEINLRNVANGVDHARRTWEALTPLQRIALCSAGQRPLERLHGGKMWYGHRGRANGDEICLLPTLLALLGRGLLEPEDETSPPWRFLITERGKFVIKHGVV